MRNSLRISFSIFMTSLLLGACDPAADATDAVGTEVAEQDEPRAVAFDAGASCKDRCDEGISTDGSCYCDAVCVKANDCCEDYELECLPKVCGGILGLMCDEGEYCDYPADANCGQGDHQGTCAEIPTGPCIEIYAPVCGCDNVTYGNECYAAKEGVSVRHNGKCEE